MGFDVLFRGHYPDEAVDALYSFPRPMAVFPDMSKSDIFLNDLLQMEISEDQISGLAV